MVVLGKPVRLVTDVLQQPERKGVPRQLQQSLDIERLAMGVADHSQRGHDALHGLSRQVLRDIQFRAQFGDGFTGGLGIEHVRAEIDSVWPTRRAAFPIDYDLSKELDVSNGRKTPP